MGKMFDLVTKTWNPIGGRCKHNCIYCWSMSGKGLVAKYSMKKYQGEPYLVQKELGKKFIKSDFVFTQDMSDLFADNVAKEDIEKVFETIKQSEATFLLLTKNPERYLQFVLPKNVVIGVTIESNRNYNVSLAPSNSERLKAMQKIDGVKMISIEPIMEFDMNEFIDAIKMIEPKFVYVGYDNYYKKLIEPTLIKTKELMKRLSDFTNVREKTLRERIG